MDYNAMTELPPLPEFNEDWQAGDQYQVVQLYKDRPDSGVFGEAWFGPPLDDLFEAAERLQSAAFPGFIQRMRNGITAGSCLWKWQGETDYNRGRFLTMGLMFPDETLLTFGGAVFLPTLPDRLQLWYGVTVQYPNERQRVVRWTWAQEKAGQRGIAFRRVTREEADGVWYKRGEIEVAPKLLTAALRDPEDPKADEPGHVEWWFEGTDGKSYCLWDCDFGAEGDSQSPQPLRFSLGVSDAGDVDAFEAFVRLELAVARKEQERELED